MDKKRQLLVDFAELGGPVYIGRPRGRSARNLMNLDMLDESEETVVVAIPEGTYALNSSYFLEMFGQSIRKFTSAEHFLEKYVFRAPEEIVEEIHDYVNRALKEKKPVI